MSNRRQTTGLLALSFLVAGGLFAARCAGHPPGGITSPEAAFGFAIGDDYQLAN